MRVTATDQGIPPKMAAVEVEMNVLRNQFDPVFTSKLYNISIDEVTSYDTSILTVTATDQDSVEQPEVNIACWFYSFIDNNRIYFSQTWKFIYILNSCVKNLVNRKGGKVMEFEQKDILFWKSVILHDVKIFIWHDFCV